MLNRTVRPRTKSGLDGKIGRLRISRDISIYMVSFTTNLSVVDEVTETIPTRRKVTFRLLVCKRVNEFLAGFMVKKLLSGGLRLSNLLDRVLRTRSGFRTHTKKKRKKKL